MEVEASADAGVVLGKRDVGRRAGSSLFCGRCPRYFGSPTEHVGKKMSESKASAFRWPKLVLFCFWNSPCASLSWTALTCTRNKGQVFGKRRCIYSGTKNANVKWTRAGGAVGAFLVAVRCRKTVAGELFVAAGNSRHFARAYHGECVRVCTLLSGVHWAWFEGCEQPNLSRCRKRIGFIWRKKNPSSILANGCSCQLFPNCVRPGENVFSAFSCKFDTGILAVGSCSVFDEFTCRFSRTSVCRGSFFFQSLSLPFSSVVIERSFDGRICRWRAAIIHLQCGRELWLRNFFRKSARCRKRIGFIWRKKKPE